MLPQEAANNLDTAAADLQRAFAEAAAVLPVSRSAARRPWASQGALDLIAERGAYRRAGDHDNEKRLRILIGKSGMKDRAS
eukprot:5038148-Pyramimonas_sp.AAC.1